MLREGDKLMADLSLVSFFPLKRKKKKERKKERKERKKERKKDFLIQNICVSRPECAGEGAQTGRGSQVV